MRAFVFALLIGCGGRSTVPPPTAGPLPEVTFQTLTGEPWSSGDALGRVVVLDVWATYCAPCKKAFPKLDRLAASSPDVVVVGISVDEDDAVVRRYLSEVPVSFLIVRDPERTVESLPLSVRKLPTVILLDRRGRVRFRAEELSEGDYDELPARVAALVAEEHAAR